MTVNCSSIKDKKPEFETSLHYLKPDIVCGTQSWLKGINQAKSQEEMQSNRTTFFLKITMYAETTEEH